MNKITDNKPMNFETFLKNSLTVMEYESIYKVLGISKKMLTIIIRNPEKMEAKHIIKFSEITKLPFDDIIKFINS